MKQFLLVMVLALLGMGCKERKNEAATDHSAAMENTDTAMGSSEEGEWTVLFDGTSLDGWHGYLQDSVPEEWSVEDGAMVFHPSEDKHGASNLVTDKEYTDFVLSLDWKISEAGNSGILWGVVEDEKYRQPYQTGPEIQILDDEKHPDSKAGPTHQAGALYDMVPPSQKTVRPVGEWNTCVITINHKTNEGKVSLNGEEVVQFPVNGDGWQQMVAKSKFADWEAFGKFPTGKIALQDHGNMVSFKNIKIKEL
ncbi:MAG: DUF1080 domain-containing protein [Sediminicola sp.]